MSVPMALLALLDDGPAHGFDLKRRYDALLGHGRELKYGQVYATLQRLERDGMAAGVGVEAGSGADRKLYAVTPQDRKSTRLNSSHVASSYAVFCSKKTIIVVAELPIYNTTAI